MTINEAQNQVDHWIKTTGVRYFNELTNMAILTEEVGELARHMSRQFGEQSYRQKPDEAPVSAEQRKIQLADEMADVLWVLLCLANQTGVDLTKALEQNFEKKTGRDSERHKQNPRLQG
jgi:NTP pyrophosphatase (non-canonical NTP hydrolase)